MTRVNAVKNSIFLIEFLLSHSNKLDELIPNLNEFDYYYGFLPLKMEKMTQLDTNSDTEFQNQLVRKGYEG